MKATNTYLIAERLNNLEYELLKRAVIALGGSYEFTVARPCVPACINHIDVPTDYEIDRLVVDSNGLTMYGRDVETDDELEIPVHEVYAGWIHFIFSYLPSVDGFEGAIATQEELEFLIKI